MELRILGRSGGANGLPRTPPFPKCLKTPRFFAAHGFGTLGAHRSSMHRHSVVIGLVASLIAGSAHAESSHLVAGRNLAASALTLLAPTLAGHSAEPGDRCADAGTADVLQLVERGARASGSLDFWPTDVSRLHVYVSKTPGPEEATAALTLAAFAARRGSEHRVTVTVRELDSLESRPFHPDDGATRVVIIRSAAAPETLLIHGSGGAPTLVLVAPRPALVTMVEALVGTEAVAPHPAPRDQRTFAALGHQAVVLGGARGTEAHLRFSQADLGGPIGAAGIRLVGTHSGGSRAARLLVSINGSVVRTIPLGPTGRFDAYSDVPRSLLARDNELRMRVSDASSAMCKDAGLPPVVNVDGASYVHLREGQRLPVGFHRFPQALLPEFEVSVDDGSVEGLDTAAQLIGALQRATHTALRPRVVDWEAGRTGRRPWLAVARHADSTRDLKLPVKPEPFRLMDSTRNEVLRVGDETRFVELVAINQQGRDGLVVTHRGWPEGMTRLGATLATARGWSALSGDAWIVPSDGLPFAMRVTGSGLSVAPMSDVDSPWWPRVRPAAFGIASIGLLAVLVMVYPRVVRDGPGRRRRAAHTEPLPDQRPDRRGLDNPR